MVIGMFHRAVRRAAIGGMLGSIASVAIVVVWWQVQIVVHGEAGLFRTAPISAFFHPEILISTGIAALLGSVPISAIAAVHDRNDGLVVSSPAFTCAAVAFLGGVVFFAYDVWCRGGFPQPPLPWPIALAIPLFAGTVAAAGLGFIAGLVWLGIRPLFLRKEEKKGSL
jgi:hypothetical protein